MQVAACDRVFKCKLDAEPSFTTCTSPKVYPDQGDGSHTFSVVAADQFGNEDPHPRRVHEYTWQVDGSLDDVTAPDTQIVGQPPDPSTSSGVSFTYTSTEPGSTFECKLDGAAFSPSSPGGQGYTNLSNGSHTFEVRATDQALNTDDTPAGYTWTVAVPPPVVNPPPVFPAPDLVPDKAGAEEEEMQEEEAQCLGVGQGQEVRQVQEVAAPSLEVRRERS